MIYNKPDDIELTIYNRAAWLSFLKARGLSNIWYSRLTKNKIVPRSLMDISSSKTGKKAHLHILDSALEDVNLVAHEIWHELRHLNPEINESLATAYWQDPQGRYSLWKRKKAIRHTPFYERDISAFSGLFRKKDRWGVIRIAKEVIQNAKKQ